MNLHDDLHTLATLLAIQICLSLVTLLVLGYFVLVLLGLVPVTLHLLLAF